VLTTGHTTTTGVLSVLADTTLTGRDVATARLLCQQPWNNDISAVAVVLVVLRVRHPSRSAPGIRRAIP
jgi:hypothetical protein